MPRVTTGNTMAPCVIIGASALELTRDICILQPHPSCPGDGCISNRHRLRTSEPELHYIWMNLCPRESSILLRAAINSALG